MFKGVIPRRMGMRMIAGVKMSSFDLPNIRSLFQTSFDIDRAFLMPTFYNSDLVKKIIKITTG
jgi:hypothetical protein